MLTQLQNSLTMKKVSILIVLLSILSILHSCRTKDGAPGPAGSSDLINQGSVSGTLYYLNYLGDSIKQPYSSLISNEFEFFDSSIATKTNGYYSPGYSVGFSRRDIADSSDSFTFSVLNSSLDSLDKPGAPAFYTMSFSFIENMNNIIFNFNSQGVYFSNDTSSNNSSCKISNFKLDTLTGRLTFSFVAKYQPYDITYSTRYDNFMPAILKGTVDVILVRNPQRSAAYIKQQLS